MDPNHSNATGGTRQRGDGARSRPLTAEQRARKRAADRKSHRKSREKTRAYISHLEELLQTRESSESGKQVETLVYQARQNRLEIHRLRSALSKVSECALSSIRGASENEDDTSQAIPSTPGPRGDILRGSQPCLDIGMPDPNVLELVSSTGLEGTNIADLLDVRGPDPFEMPDVGSTGPSSTIPLSISQEPGLGETQSTAAGGLGLLRPETAMMAHFESPRPSAGTPTLLPVSSHYERNTGGASVWSRLSSISSSIWQFSSNLQQLVPDPPHQEAHAEDVLVRAIFQGWDAIPQHCTVDPVWQAVRRIDQQLFAAYSVVGRLAMLYVIQLQLHVC